MLPMLLIKIVVVAVFHVVANFTAAFATSALQACYAIKILAVEK